MYPVYRKMLNAHGLSVLTKAPVMPNPNLAIAGDDEMEDIPLLIFRDQHQPMPAPVMEHIYNLPYEKTAAKGANDTLSMADFETENFGLGAEYDFLV